MNWAQANYLASVVFAAVLLYVLSQHGGTTAYAAVWVLCFAWASSYAQHLVYAEPDAHMARYYTRAAIISLFLALAFAAVAVLRY